MITGANLQATIRQLLHDSVIDHRRKMLAESKRLLSDHFAQYAAQQGGGQQVALGTSDDQETFFAKFDPLLNVTMIDFTHAFADTAQLDTNYLQGVKNLIKFTTQFLDSLAV